MWAEVDTQVTLISLAGLRSTLVAGGSNSTPHLVNADRDQPTFLTEHLVSMSTNLMVKSSMARASSPLTPFPSPTFVTTLQL